MLYQIQHDYKAKLWCGIAALAAITGRPTSVCRDEVAKVRRYHNPGAPVRISGIYHFEMTEALQALGYRAQQVARFHGPAATRPTLAAWLKTRDGALTKGVLLITIGQHFVTVEGKRFVDNRQQDPVFIREAAGRRSRVRRVYLVQRATALGRAA